jgi:ABC-type glycerol-3-phosphate transport system substrate-binding protein
MLRRDRRVKQTDMRIRTLIIIAALAALTGCGAETMSAAATSASIKKQELQEGQKTLDRAQERIGQATDVLQQRANQAAERD